LRQLHRTVRRIGPHQPRRERLKNLPCLPRIAQPDIIGQPPRPPGKRRVAQLPYQRRYLADGKLALIHLPADRQRHRQHRIAEGIFLRTIPGPRHLAQQVDGCVAVGVEIVRHRAGSSTGRARDEGKQFFFEKKNQKTFTNCVQLAV
jgi:hypothetical protein